MFSQRGQGSQKHQVWLLRNKEGGAIFTKQDDLIVES